MERGFSMWKEAPFIRLVTPLIAGIMISDAFDLPLFWYGSVMAGAFGVMALLSRLDVALRFRSRIWLGVSIQLALLAFGGLLGEWRQVRSDVRVVEEWCRGSPAMELTVDEPAVARQSSYKAMGTLTVSAGGLRRPVSLPVILYFRKTGVAPPAYGSRLVVGKPPQRIRNITGTRSFDYARYCALHGLYFQMFLRDGDYRVLPGSEAKRYWSMLFTLRAWVITVLRDHVPGKKEYGLAEALLIGYRDDLDKELLQAYSTMGVVHVVAISGLHLGLVYGLLKGICRFTGLRRSRHASALIIVSGLWLFSLLAGGSPSVLRSAVMFSFVVAGETMGRKTSLFNNLAASAFLLLCYDPLWLWDTGFQLSYAALAGIGLFQQPIYALIHCRNPLLDTVWKLNAVTLAAQVLTIPLCLYYFHQFPTLFLVANCIAVPLSGLILSVEIALCCVAFIPLLASGTGLILSWLLMVMDWSVEGLAGWKFASVTRLHINVAQAVLLYVLIAAVAIWLMRGERKAVPAALVAAILFMAVRLI